VVNTQLRGCCSLASGFASRIAGGVPAVICICVLAVAAAISGGRPTQNIGQLYIFKILLLFNQMVKYALRRIHYGASDGACNDGTRAIVVVATSITTTIYIKSVNYLYLTKWLNMQWGEFALVIGRSSSARFCS